VATLLDGERLAGERLGDLLRCVVRFRSNGRRIGAAVQDFRRN
jgi:hypothetical protein